MKTQIKDTLLLIGSADSDRAQLHDIFESRYYLLEAENAAQGCLLLKQNYQCIAAVIADIPLIEETSIRELIQTSHPDQESEIPVIILVTPVGTGQQEERAFLMGAADVVLKPYAQLSIQRRVQVLVDLYLHQQNLEKIVADQSQTIRNSYQSILDTMSSIIEGRNVDSGNHVLRIRGFAKILLQEVAKCHPEYKLTPESIDIISAATSLHDIGKIVIPDAILNKPGPLTAEEFEIMKTHTTLGSEFVSQLNGAGEAVYLRYAYNICLYHHERWDGGGYPKGLAGDAIPICAQVAGITDAFDALTTPRVYKPAIDYKDAFIMILNGKCGAFSPKLLECFKRSYRKLVNLAEKYADEPPMDNTAIQTPLPAPEPQTIALDAVQASQLKYQTLLHYMNDTVIELDLDNRLYHVVNNPNPDFVQVIGNERIGNTFENLFQTVLHPEDAEILAQYQQEIAQKLFKERQRKYAFRCRMYNPLQDEYDPYLITLLRVNTWNPNQRIALAVCHNASTDASREVPAHPQNPSALCDFMSSTLRCRADADLWITEGCNTLSALTSYIPWEISREFSDSLIQMVHPQDRQIVLAMVLDVRENPGQQEGLFRMCHKQNQWIWVLGRSRIQTEWDGSQFALLTLTDISSVMTFQQKQSRDYFRNRLIVEQFKNVILEWNLVTDELICSDQWEERFGYRVGREHFSQLLDGPSHIHPDDLSQLRKKIKTFRQKEAVDTLDLRIADSQGRYCWNRIRAVSRAEGQDKPTCIIAVIYNIDDLKQDVLTLKKRAEQDALTKLLNKDSTQRAITEYLKNREQDAMAALMVLDVDNFKTVNDNFGHLYGDAILTHLGATLRSLFRSWDVIGRVGGDEFLVLLKDVPNLEVVKDRCQLIVDTFRHQMQHLMPAQQVSLSVGCALIPDHGSNWSELYKHADEALYMAKSKGKGQYWIYDLNGTYTALIQSVKHTRIDSDEQPALDEDILVRQVFHNLYVSQDLDASIQEVLAFVGRYFNVSRVYIFENNHDNTCCDNTFEWCNVGITPQIENLQGVNYERDVPNWQRSFNENGILYSSDISELAPDLRAVLEPQGIKSVLHCAIMDQGLFRGVVGFDECNSSCLWTQGQISLLQFLAEVLSVFLLKRHSTDDHRDS